MLRIDMTLGALLMADGILAEALPLHSFVTLPGVAPWDGGCLAFRGRTIVRQGKSGFLST